MKARRIFLTSIKIWLVSLLSALVAILVGLSACQAIARYADEVFQGGASETYATSPAGVEPEVPSTPGVTVYAPRGGGVESSAALLPFVRTDSLALIHAPRYTMQLALDYQALTFQGLAQVDYNNSENVPLERLYFRLLPNGGGSYGDGSLVVTQVEVAGQPAQVKLSLKDTLLEIKLPGVLHPGESLRMDFEFNGAVSKDFGNRAHPTGYGIYNYSDGVLALSGWYPILAVYDHQGWNLDPVAGIGDSVYSDIAFYTLDISLPSDLKIVATGVEVSRQVSEGVAHIRFESGPARDFFLVASPDFQVESLTVDGTTVNSYYLPGYRNAALKALSVATDSLHIFNQKFGPYPYTELDVVEAPMNHALGVEYPGVFLVSASLYDAPGKPEFVVTTAHEVAHQWWYNVVGNDVFDEPWLDEALTTYSSSLYYEFRPDGMVPNGMIEHWQNRYDRLLQEGEDDLITQSLAYFESLEAVSIYGGVVYNKGALFFHALRREIGDEAFFAALKAYYQAHQYQIATSQDLLQTVEKASGRDLETFYQEWLYSKDL